MKGVTHGSFVTKWYEMSHRIQSDQVISEDKFWNQGLQWDGDQNLLVPCQPSREALSMTHISPCCFVKM